jgi:hypothetical protein
MPDQPSNQVQHVTDVYSMEPLVPGTPGEPAVYQPTTGSLQRLEAEAAAMATAFKLATGLCQTPMVPDHFHGENNAHALAAAILYGAELGLTAMQSAQNVFVVHGKPAVYARTMAAQVRRAGYRIEEVEASDERVVWRAERDGSWAMSEWSIERAAQAGYTTNKKYASNPQEMLRAKCIAEVCRIQYQDVLLGMAYSVEELQLDNVTVQRVVRRENRGAAALRDIAQQNEDRKQEAKQIEQEVVVQPEGIPDPQPVSGDSPASAEQVDRIKRLYKAKFMTGTAVLDDITDLLCLDTRPTAVTKLTADQASDLLKLLETPATEGA